MVKRSSALCFIAALSCALASTGCSKKARRTSSLKPAPEFSLKDADGKTVHLSDYRGKVVLLDFWATWCGPCKMEIPWFIDFERQFKDKGFAVVGVSMDEDGWAAINPYIKSMGMNYRVLLGNDDVGSKYGGVESLPTTFLIDRDGGIVRAEKGVTMKKEEFQHVIQQVIDSENVRVPSPPHGGVLAFFNGPNSR